MAEPAIPSPCHRCLDVHSSRDPFTDKHRGEQAHWNNQNQGDTQGDQHSRLRAAPFPFESFVQGIEDDPEYSRPSQRHEKRLEDSKHEISQAQDDAVEEHVTESIFGSSNHGESKSPSVSHIEGLRASTYNS